ncbi:glycosyltransferase family protein [Curtobacterium citreum]
MPDPRTTQDDQAALYRALAAGEHRSGGAGRGAVAFAVSTDDVEAGAGDVYVALGLAKYLARRGWGVLLWPTERWETPLPEDVTVVVSMIESFVPGLVPQHVGLVAWVRNWTDVWAEQPWLDEYDAVWTSSTAARDRIAERTERPVRVLPIGVDHELFTGERDGRDDVDVVTTVNFWGAERLGTAAIDVLAETRQVVWYGANREHLVRSGRIEHRGHASFFDLPAVYASARVVVDDVIPPARAYATHNSRLFEGLASGALVVTNCAEGLDELGLEGVPTYEDGPGLVAAAADHDPALVERLRAVVLDRHTYAARAEAADEDLRRAVTARAGRTGADRGAFLVWATTVRKQLRTAEHDRDVHFAGVHDINERLVAAVADAQRAAAETAEARAAVAALTAERDRLAVRLDEVTRSRTYRLAEQVARLAHRR